ncbi:hypothetical protein NC651_009841 [Populus alba x Populus x berolinensis]|nr:hypothetical protein NC651_009841 [Populus alba x Populus x berolinensis]
MAVKKIDNAALSLQEERQLSLKLFSNMSHLRHPNLVSLTEPEFRPPMSEVVQAISTTSAIGPGVVKRRSSDESGFAFIEPPIMRPIDSSF